MIKNKKAPVPAGAKKGTLTMNVLSKKRLSYKTKKPARRIGKSLHIKSILKLVVVDWYCRGVLPEPVVEGLFKKLKLGAA